MEECDECGHALDDDDYIIESEPRNFWGAICYEQIVVGYVCAKCGHEEKV